MIIYEGIVIFFQKGNCIMNFEEEELDENLLLLSNIKIMKKILKSFH